MKKILSKIGNIFFYVFVGLMVVIIGCGIYEKSSGKKILPVSYLYVTTASMEPDIPMNSYILVTKVYNTEKLKEHDVISFISNDPTIYRELNTHEIVEILEDGNFRTKGYNNSEPDTVVAEKEDVVYKYVCNLSFLTACRRAFTSGAGLPCVLVLCLGGVVLYLNYYLKKCKKEENKEKEEKMKELVALEVERLKKEHKDLEDK